MNSCTCKKLSETHFLVVLTLTGECTWKSGKVTHHFFWKVLEAHSHYHKKLSTRNRASRNRNSNRKHFSHHPMIVMSQSWLALSTGRILRKNSCFSPTTREITFSLFETEVMLLSIAVNSQYSNMKNRLLRQQIEIWIATCSEQTADQNTNIAWQYCKVARKRTTGFTEITQHLQGEYSCLLLVLITHNLWCYFYFF